jgi:lipid-binding SYLF domain-containing protein
MKRTTTSAAALIVILALAFPLKAGAGIEEEQKVESAVEVMTEILDIPEKGMPPSLLKGAEGIAVIPGVVKVGFVLGGRFGRGVMSIRTKKGAWSNPTFVNITGGSIGWQIGAQSTDVILVFKTKKSVDGVTKGKFTLGADAAIAAGPVGRRAEAATDSQLKAEIYSYSRSRGLFAGIALEGSSLKIDNQWNAAYYGKQGISVEDVFNGKTPKPPAVTKKFKKSLGK